MSTFSERLADLIGGPEQAKRGNTEFARKVGLSEGAIRSYLKGTQPKLDVLVQIAKATGVHINWLATGEGPRDSSHVMGQGLEGTQREQMGGAMFQGLSNQQLLGNDFVLLPRYEVRASAGQGIVNTDEDVRDFVAFERTYLRSAGINPTHADVIQVEGRSMMPSFVDGEWVVVDRSSTRIVPDAVYAVLYDESLLIKRLRRDLDGTITLISDNQAEGYVAVVIAGENLSRFSVVGRVRRHLRSL